MTNNFAINNNNSQVKKENSFANAAIGVTGAVIGFEAEPYIRRFISKPSGRMITTGMIKCQGGDYSSYLQRALKQNNLEGSVCIVNLNESNIDEVKKLLKIKDKPTISSNKVVKHVLRMKNKNKIIDRISKGQDALFVSRTNTIICNLDKFSASVFHELAHKMNFSSNNIFFKILTKIRGPLALFGPMAISIVSLVKDPKKDDEGRKGVGDFIKEHCGLLAAGAVLPLTIEECIANIRGTKIAKDAGVTGDLFKKVKNLHKLSAASYCLTPVFIGLSVYLASKLRDCICLLKSQAK